MNVAMTCDLYITAKTAKCRQNTLDGYISAIRCHVLPKWGERELCDILSLIHISEPTRPY